MRKITATELTEILRLHAAWNRGEKNGVRANLSSANLYGSNLSGSDLSRANLSGSNLYGAKYSHKGVVAKKFMVFVGLYKYTVIAMIAEDGSHHIALGCKFQTREQWTTNFWNNNSEFPDDGSESTKMRKFALQTGCNWLDIASKFTELVA